MVKLFSNTLWSIIYLVSIGVFSIGLGLYIGNAAYRSDIKLLISSDVFNGLLVTIAIFIGYISVILVFYLGKTDEYEREFLCSLNDVRNYEQQLFTSMHQIYSKFEGFEHRSMLEDYGKELFRTEMEKIESGPLYTKKMRDDILNELGNFRSMIIRWGVFSLVMYLVGLFCCIMALLLLEQRTAILVLDFLSIASVIIVVNACMFIEFWCESQKTLNVYRRAMVNSQDYVSSRLGEMMTDVNKFLRSESQK